MKLAWNKIQYRYDGKTTLNKLGRLSKGLENMLIDYKDLSNDSSLL